MSYLKLWKACQDYGLGLASVNTAKTNLDAQAASWTAEHGGTVASRPVLLGDPYNAFGAHNTPPVPRAVVRVVPASASGGLSIQIATNVTQDIVRAVTRVGTGLWQFSLDNRLSLFFADPQPAQTTNAPVRFCSPYGAVVAGYTNGLIVGTYDLQAGDFVLTDYEFSCAIYAYV